MHHFYRTTNIGLPEGKRKQYEKWISQLTPPRTDTDKVMLSIYEQLLLGKARLGG